MLRNQLCSCGSGKRYKHCHGLGVVPSSAAGSATEAPAPVQRDPGDTLKRALAAQRNGQLQIAEALYEAALQMLPGHFDALHMLGVVKLQLGKFDDARRRLVEALPRVPEDMLPHFKHNLALCLTGAARERGLLVRLTQPSVVPGPPAPFVYRTRNEVLAAIEPGVISVIVTHAGTIDDLEKTLDSIRAATPRPTEVVVAAIAAGSGDSARIETALATRGLPGRVESGGAAGTAQCIDAAAVSAASGEYLAFVRAGDAFGQGWPARMIAAMRERGALWGFSGLRVVDAAGGIVRYGNAPDSSRLLAAQDELYLHETPSLALLGFNPIAAGRNLVARKDWWRARGGFGTAAGDSHLEWAWRVAQQHEPLYLDQPDYLIPEGTAALHLHEAAPALLAETARIAPAGTVEQRSVAGADNACLHNGIARFWARQWEQIFALEVTVMPLAVLSLCANMLESGTRRFGPQAVG